MFVFSSWNARQMLYHNNVETTVSTNPFTRLGCSLLFWTAREVTVTSSVFFSIKHVFIPISSGSENYSKRTQRMASSAAIVATLASSEQCSTHHRFRLINVLHRFVGAERSPVLSWSTDQPAQPGWEISLNQLIYIKIVLPIFIYVHSCVVLRTALHCPLSGPDLIYISLWIIFCIIEYVTNKRTLS